MYNQQNNGNLPFNAYQCMTQPMQFNSPPFVPNNIAAPPALTQHVPALCVMIANEAGMACGKNPGRMFLFNQLSENSYSNTFFAQIVQTAMDFLLLGFSKNNYNSIQAGLSDSVTKALMVANAINFSTYPALRNIVGQDILITADKILNDLPDFYNQIETIKRQVMGLESNNSFGNSNMGSNNNSYSNNQQQTRQSFDINSVVNSGFNQPSSLFQNNSNTQNVQQSNSTSSLDQQGRYDNIKKIALTTTGVNPVINQNNFFKQANQQNNQAIPIVPQLSIAQVTKEIKWRPSPAQWHPVTCDTRYQKVLLKEVVWVDDQVYPISYVVNLSEEEMEEAKHRIGYVEQAIISTTPTKYETRQEAITKNIDNFVKRNKDVRDTPVEGEEGNDAFSIINTARRTVCSNFLAPAIFEGRVKMKKDLHRTENDVAAYGINAIIATPVLVDASQERVLSQLKDCTSFSRIQIVMKNLLKPQAPTGVSKNFVAKLDKMFTKELNSILKNRLSLDVQIESFTEDVMSIPGWLRDNGHGDVVVNAYLSGQDEFINTYLNQDLIDDELEQGMIEDLQLNSEDESGFGETLDVAFITQYITLTYLQVMSSDLSISMSFDVAGEILLSKNPELFKLASEMFAEEESKVIPVAHRLLITSDNVVFEFHRGLINKDFVTISRYS